MYSFKKRKCFIYIYKDNKKLGTIYPDYSQKEEWVIDSGPNQFTNLQPGLHFEKIFFKTFGTRVDDIPNLEEAMKVAFDLVQAIVVADKLKYNL